MGIKIAKFGGSSLADASQFKKVAAILRADESRRYIVPSAPGKRFSADEKITDMLYKCYAMASAGQNIDCVFDKIADRYLEIIKELGLGLDFAPYLETVRKNLQDGASMDYTASRGEYLNGIILAAYMGYAFIDAAEVIFFNRNGVFDQEKTNDVMRERLQKTEYAVIPGFYGSLPDGNIKTFSRGGSDITGSIVARAAGAELYENWTDVSGFLVTDPRIVENPAVISFITYRELRELSYMGATVLHEEAVFPVSKCGIPINIRNTNDPAAPGTMIVPKRTEELSNHHVITGIAGHMGYSIVTIEKDMMNSELGFGRRVLQVFEKHNVSFEHLPSGIDTLSVVLSTAAIAGKTDSIIADLQKATEPDSIEIIHNLALIAVVGHGMSRTRGTAGKLFTALGNGGVNIRTIDQGSSEMNIIVGVDEQDFEESIRIIYDAFMK